MYYYKARIYSPTIGVVACKHAPHVRVSSILQTDPIGYEDQFNLYAYVGNDPINNVDPDGKQALDHSAAYQPGGRLYGTPLQTEEREKGHNNPVGKDGVLSLDEATRHARYGNGKAVTVDASKLTVEVYANQESSKVKGLYGGQVQGAGKFVHGGVSVYYDRKTGRASIVSETYDFEYRSSSTLRGIGRNIATIIGHTLATNYGIYKITTYQIHFRGQPKVIFVE